MKTRIFIADSYLNTIFGDFNNLNDALLEFQKLHIEKGWRICEVTEGVIDDQYTVYIYIE